MTPVPVCRAKPGEQDAPNAAPPARLRINGAERTCVVDADTPLLWVLRDALELAGTKYGCGVARCGACTVLHDGVAIRSCITPISTVGGAITTIEGEGDLLTVVREAWLEENVAQCGYCQSGQVMSAVALLSHTRAPDDDAIDEAMSGNVCRCGSYPRIRKAIHRAAKRLAGASGHRP